MNRVSSRRAVRSLAWLALTAVFAMQTATAATPPAKHHRHRRRTAAAAHTTAASSAASGSVAHTTTRAGVIHTNVALTAVTTRRRVRHRVYFNPWTEPTYADSTIGDNIDGEDLVVRKAAVDALGPYNGSVVVADPQNGRILSIVNQKLALKGAFQPCSTVKMMVSLASLSEGIVNPDKPLRITRRYSMDMTQALAHSNNLYFARLGQELGFDRVEKYSKLFGYGEKAGLDIPGEEPGFLADEPPKTGVGMMTSFGDGIRVTPLELTSIVTAIANGGTMYYLQYPKNQEEVEKFVPRIKRELDIRNLVSEIKPGMMGAVEYGTARRANYDPTEPVFGKTGTCTDTTQPGVHLGWFGSFNDVGNRKLVVVVLLTGGRGVAGPIAAGVAGNVYRNLSLQHYFAPAQPPMLPAAMVSMQDSLVQKALLQ
ncbi:MAG TPA: penicillin-binding transpeptidase domain-containing protein [Bryobacteraceae bacterium]|nr:penicillin-binding transpeptidase domain-containing protein [Bryobacteraceae bacterium]